MENTQNNNKSGVKTLLKTRMIYLLLGCLCLIAGCDSFTEVDLPPSQLTSVAVFEDKATATAAVVDIYSKIRDTGMLTGYSSGLSASMGLYADELVLYGGEAGFYNNAVLPTAYEVSDWWNYSYSQIYAANAVLEGLQQSTALAETDKSALMGEVLFIRALLHFYLVNAFGPVPYIKTTDYRVNRLAARTPEAEAYANMKADLEQAIYGLPAAYVTAERVRPNRFAAQALLARVALYNGDWAEASNAASAVLNETGLYSIDVPLDAVFREESRSTIWQLMPQMQGRNTLEAETFSFTEGPPPSTALSQSLLAAFPEGDLRKANWTTAVTDGTETWYHTFKYREALGTESSMEYSIVFRIAEMYLIRVEARARWGDLIGAKEDLNVILNHAGLPDSEAHDAETIVVEILLQRRLELFTEFGHRFFDLKRSNRLDAVLSPQKPGWNATDRLLPLPESELLLNDRLAPQNDGY